MGSKGWPLFDLNEPPAEEDEESNGAFCFQPQKAVPSSHCQTSDLFPGAAGSEKLVNNNAFSHASSVSGFQPFIRSRSVNGSEEPIELKKTEQQNSEVASSSKPSNGKNADMKDMKTPLLLDSGSADAQALEKEEGEWSDNEGSADATGSSMREQSITGKEEQLMAEMMDHCASENISHNVKILEGTKDEGSSHSLGLDTDSHVYKSNTSQNLDRIAKGDIPMDGQEEHDLVPKQKEVKGVEASHALRLANNPGKRQKLDQHKEAMLGKKRSRRTMFLNLEDVKQAGPIKTTTPRRQNFAAPITVRTVKENRTAPLPTERTGEKQGQPMIKEQKQVDMSNNDGSATVESGEPKFESNGDLNSGLLGRPRRLNSVTDLSAEAHPPLVPRQSSWKQPTDSRQLKNPQAPPRKPALIRETSMDPKLGNKKNPPKKPTVISTQYQDTSVERLLREVTNEKFWHHPGPCRVGVGDP